MRSPGLTSLPVSTGICVIWPDALDFTSTTLIGSTAPVADAQSMLAALAYRAPEFDGDAESRPFMLQPYATVALHDGRGANQPWMQELPDPITKLWSHAQ